jgi:hypothetical protein
LRRASPRRPACTSSSPSGSPFSNCLLPCLVHSGAGKLAIVGLGFDLDKRPGRTVVRSPRAVPWETTLPWAPATLNQSALVVPVRDGPGCGSACAKGVDKRTCPGAGTSVTARTPNACARSAAGWRRGGKPSGGWTKRPKHSTPRQNGRAVSAPRLRRKHPILRKLRRRVVTQRKVFFNSFVRPAGVL